MIASSAIRRTAAISILNLSQKMRVSSAASREGGGAVGIIRSSMLRPAGFAPRERRLMPRETFSRKRAARPATPAPTIFILMTPDEPTPAMQNPEKDPEEWTTGEEPMTGPQRSYLQTLCREAGEEIDIARQIFFAAKIFRHECILEFSRTASRPRRKAGRVDLCSNLTARNHCFPRDVDYDPSRSQALTRSQDGIRCGIDCDPRVGAIARGQRQCRIF